MINFEEFACLDGINIYKKLANSWRVTAIDRQPTWREVTLIPIYDGYAPMGASILIAIMAYPNDIAKQEAYIKAVAAWTIKRSAPPRSTKRAQLRKDPEYAWAIDVPNKRIQQRFNDCSRHLARRFRAAWVLLHKLASNPDPSMQSPLQASILKAAAQNTRSYPAFFSEKIDLEDQEENITDSFRRRILYPAKPVIHLAISLYLRFETEQPEEISLFKIIQNADQWLKQTLIAAEVFRVYFGDLFPRSDTQYMGGNRVQNFSAPMGESIAILPYIDSVQPYMDSHWFLHDSRKHAKSWCPIKF